MKLNITKIIEARKNLVIEGAPRKALIEEAIATIQKDPKGAFLERYIGNIFKAQEELNFFNKMIDETNFEFIGIRY